MTTQPPPFESNSLFARIFHASPVAMTITDLEEGCCVDANDAYVQLTGYSRDELIGRRLADLVWIDKENRAGLIDEARRGSSVTERTFQLQARDGSIRDVIGALQVEQWDNRAYIITFIQDLTGYYQTQESLRSSKARFRLFFESIPLPLFVHDADTLEILSANPAACRYYGYSLDELIGASILSLRPPEQQADFGDLIAGLPRYEAIVAQSQHQKKDGAITDVTVNSYGMRLDGRDVRLAIIEDITQKLATRHALEESENHLRVIAEVMTDAIWDYDTISGAINYLGGIRSLFGYGAGPRPAPEWWRDHIHPEDREAVQMSIRHALERGGDMWTAQYRFLKADGQYAQVLDRGYVLRDDNGQVVRMIGAMVDISREVAIKEATARAAIQERQRLARDLHDAVTQSLYSLSLMAEAARRRAVLGDVEATNEYILRLGELARRSLKEMRLLVYELQPTALEEEGLVGALRVRLDAIAYRGEVQTTLLAEAEQDIPIKVQVQLFRVAEEAINNALRHAGASSIVVRLQTTPQQALLEVSDNGQGFEPERAATSGGIGLASMRERVENLGGVFELDTRPGMGATVRVMLDL